MVTKLKLDSGLINNSASHMQGGGELFTTGKVWYVNSVIGSDGNTGTDPKLPLATVQQAITSARADKGDAIVVMAKHAETVTASSLNLSKAGITIVNMGVGRTTMPTYTFDAAASTIDVSAADVTWIGGNFQATKLDVASAFTVAAAKNFSVSGVFAEDTSAILNFLSIVTTTTTDNAADGLSVTDNFWYGLNTTPLAFVSILGDTLYPTVSGNVADLAATSGGEFITMAAKDVNGARFTDNYHTVVGATGTTTGIFLTGSGTAMTGIVKGNMVSSLDTTTELIATAGTGLVYFENYYTGTADASGKLWPVVDGA